MSSISISPAISTDRLFQFDVLAPKNSTTIATQRFAIYFLSALAAAGGIALIALAATGLIPPPLAVLSLPLFTLSVLLFMTAREMHDYDNPKELQGIIEKAKKQPIEKLVREHGLENLSQYQIIPEERIQEYETIQQTLAQARDLFRREHDALDQKYKGRKEALLSELHTIEWEIRASSDQEFKSACEELRAQAGCPRREKFDSVPFWVSRKMHEKYRQITANANVQFSLVEQLRNQARTNSICREQQGLYEEEIRQLVKEHQMRIQAIKFRRPGFVLPEGPAPVIPQPIRFRSVEELTASVEKRIALVRSLIQQPAQ